MDIWIGTGNQGKLVEFRELFPQDFKILSLKDLKSFTMPPENGKTFDDNARIKAKNLHSVKSENWVIGEDSGLEVDGLQGMPGIFSARYAGNNARDVENTSKVLKMINMRSAANRKAQFRSVIIAYDPKGTEYKFEGILKGEIAKDMRGTNGFGYDSIFIPEGLQKTFGEMSVIEKNKISHRSIAVKQLVDRLKITV